MDFRKAKVQMGEWWIVENTDKPGKRFIIHVGFIYQDYININSTRCSVNKEQLNFIRYVDLQDDEATKKKVRRESKITPQTRKRKRVNNK